MAWNGVWPELRRLPRNVQNDDDEDDDEDVTEAALLKRKREERSKRAAARARAKENAAQDVQTWKHGRYVTRPLTSHSRARFACDLHPTPTPRSPHPGYPISTRRKTTPVNAFALSEYLHARERGGDGFRRRNARCAPTRTHTLRATVLVTCLVSTAFLFRASRKSRAKHARIRSLTSPTPLPRRRVSRDAIATRVPYTLKVRPRRMRADAPRRAEPRYPRPHTPPPLSTFSTPTRRCDKQAAHSGDLRVSTKHSRV